MPGDMVSELQSLGAMLRQAREARALSLEEVETQTRIRVKYLQALESGDLSVMPSPLHAKGFLRNYAQFLRLDANTIVAQFGDLTGAGGRVTVGTAPAAYETLPPLTTPAAQQPDSGPYPGQPTPAAPRPTTYVTPDQRQGRAMPAGVTSVPNGRGRPVQPPNDATAGREPKPGPVRRILRSSFFVIAILLVGLVGIGYWSLTTLRGASMGQIVPTPVQSDFLQQFAAEVTVSPSPTFPPTSTPTQAVGPQILDRVVLTIRVVQRTWTRVEVDGVTVFEGQAEPDTILQYEGLESVRVRTGNGAGLIVTYNGQDLGVLGERAEVVDRTFTPSQQITPTYTPTVTLTPTNVPTSTPRDGSES